MKLPLWSALAAILDQTIAQNSDDDYLGPSGANNATTPTEQDGRRTIHYVTVGKIEHEFQPNSIVAAIGDIVSFQFYPLNHSVIQAKYGYPCIPIDAVDYEESQFYSEFFPVNSPDDVNPPTWNLTINSTEPIFYYCGAPGSCTDWGMVGAINANGSMSLATQIKLAHEADYMLLPGQQFPSEAVEASLSALAHSATVTTTTQIVTKSSSPSKSPTATPTSDNDSSALSSGAVAGIAVGAAVVALVVAALFFLMCRTRKLKRKLELKTAASRVPSTWEQPGSPAAPYTGAYYDPNRHNSQLPPYRPYHHLERPDMNKASRVESWPVDSAGNPILTPATTYVDGYHSPPQPHPHSGQWNMNQDLRSTSPAAELHVRHQEMVERRT